MPTPNHGYETPQKNQSNWHIPLNENFRALDADVIIKGTYDERPDSVQEGRWYLATDTRKLYYDTGSGWQTIGTPAITNETTQQTTSLAPHTLRFGDNLTPTANGDGTVTIDATGDLTDTRTDVSDDTTHVVSDVTDINFGTNLGVTDDGDGSVTVDALGDLVDTRTNISDSGILHVTDCIDINFRDNLSVIDDGDGTVTVDATALTQGTDRVNISDDNIQIVQDAGDINFGANLAVTNDGDGTVTVTGTGGGGGAGDTTQEQRIPFTHLTDTDKARWPVRVPQGYVLDVLAMGVMAEAGGAPTGLQLDCVEVADPTVVYGGIEAQHYSTGSPMFQIDRSTDSGLSVMFRLNNQTGGDLIAGGLFKYDLYVP